VRGHGGAGCRSPCKGGAVSGAGAVGARRPPSTCEPQRSSPSGWGAPPAPLPPRPRGGARRRRCRRLAQGGGGVWVGGRAASHQRCLCRRAARADSFPGCAVARGGAGAWRRGAQGSTARVARRVSPPPPNDLPVLSAVLAPLACTSTGPTEGCATSRDMKRVQSQRPPQMPAAGARCRVRRAPRAAPRAPLAAAAATRRIEPAAFERASVGLHPTVDKNHEVGRRLRVGALDRRHRARSPPARRALERSPLPARRRRRAPLGARRPPAWKRSVMGVTL
jgi:hypothetical protein